MKNKREVLEETINDPLERRKEQLLEDVGEKSLPSQPRQFSKVAMPLEKLKEVMREDEEVDVDYVFKFMDEFIRKPLERGFEDMFQCRKKLTRDAITRSKGSKRPGT